MNLNAKYRSFVKRLFIDSNLGVFLLLLFAGCVAALALWYTASTATNRLRNMADTESEMVAKRLQTATNTMISYTQWIISSHLTSWMEVDTKPTADNPDQTGQYILSNQQLAKLSEEDIITSVQSFLRYNYGLSAYILLLHPGASMHYPDGLYLRITADSATRLSADVYNHMIKSRLYQNTQQHHYGIYFEVNHIRQSHDWTLTASLNLQNTHHQQIGEIWIDISAKDLSDFLSFHQASSDLKVIMVSNTGSIIASNHQDLNGEDFEQAVLTRSSLNQTGWYEQTTQLMQQKQSGSFATRIGKLSCRTYVYPIQDADCWLLVIKDTQYIYNAVHQIGLRMFAVIFGGLLLLAASLVLAFLSFKRKNDKTKHIETELLIASQIQQRILPANPPANSLWDYDIYGFQQQAKSVGGDLYDFALIGQKLHFCIGDVSGKGVPAAIIMSEICSLYRHLIHTQQSAVEIMTNINNALLERGDDSMFATLFIGILNLNNGYLDFCNAGHNPPFLFHKQTGQTRLLSIRPNLPICTYKNYEYQSESLQLEAGDGLFLYTDGVTEAKNENNEFWGVAALSAHLQAHANHAFEPLMQNLMQTLSQYAGKAEQHDDITMLGIHFHPETTIQHLHFDRVKQQISNIVDSVLQACQLSNDTRLRLVVEEPIQNIADYAYAQDGPLDIEIGQKPNCNTLWISLIDSGKPFNPLQVKAPRTDISLEQRKIGGLGIFLTRQFTDSIDYRYENHQNILTLKYTHL